MRREGKSKAEVEGETGSTIGVYDADFEVYQGEIFVVIGLSGSGKSTLLRLINRLIEPTEGRVHVDEDLISEMDKKEIRKLRRQKMGMVFQHFGLLPNRTVLSNIGFGLEIQGVGEKERGQASQEALEMVGLHGQGEKRITELSGGMQQRVGLARALATKQEILLMDEPFSALDPLIRRDMQNLFLDIQGEIKRTVLFITHDLDEALMLGHRVAIMKDGEIVQIGTPEEILTNPADEYVERFVEDVDYAKVRYVDTVMVEPKEVAYDGEGPRVVLRRMKQAGLSEIFVVDDERRLLGICEAEEVAKLAEQRGAEARRRGRRVGPQRRAWYSLAGSAAALCRARAADSRSEREQQVRGCCRPRRAHSRAHHRCRRVERRARIGSERATDQPGWSKRERGVEDASPLASRVYPPNTAR